MVLNQTFKNLILLDIAHFLHCLRVFPLLHNVGTGYVLRENVWHTSAESDSKITNKLHFKGLKLLEVTWHTLTRNEKRN